MSLLARKASKVAVKGAVALLMISTLTFFMYMGIGIIVFLVLEMQPTLTNAIIVGILALFAASLWFGKNVYDARKEHEHDLAKHYATEAAIGAMQTSIEEKKSTTEVMTVTSKFIDNNTTNDAQYVTVLENKSMNKIIEYRHHKNAKVVYYTVERGREYAIAMDEDLITKVGESKLA